MCELIVSSSPSPKDDSKILHKNYYITFFRKERISKEEQNLCKLLEVQRENSA
jgi:hypothetical protein